MSNINRLIVYGNDNMEQFLNEMNVEPITTDQTYSFVYTSISSQQATSPSQLVVDERSNYFNLTNRRINDVIVYQSRSHHSSILTVESAIPIGESHPWTEDSVFDYVFAANRDGQPTNRIAHPSDDILINLSSPVVIPNIIVNNIPLGIENTEPHTLVLPVFVNTARRDIINNNEHGDINEDGTLFNDTDDSINEETMNSTTIGIGNQMIVRESIGVQPTDDSTNNLNPIAFIDAQDNRYLDISNRVERRMEYDNTSEIEHQHSLDNDSDERGQVLLRLEHDNDHEVHDNVQSNMPTAPILPLSVPRTSTIGESSEQAEEIEPLLAGPTDNNSHTRADPAHLLITDLDVSQFNALDRKQSNPFNMSEKAGEEETIQ